jgi:hypothetical protein
MKQVPVLLSLIHTCTKKSRASKRIRKSAKYKLREGICSKKMESLKKKRGDQQRKFRCS